MSSPLEPSVVIHEHAAFVWRVLRHLGVRDAQLEDASQEVLVTIFRRLPDFAGRASLRSWIYGICRNVAAHVRRGNASAREQLVAELPDAGSPACQDAALALKRQHARLLEVLSTLDDDQRQVFVLYEIEELSMEEIADALAAPLTSCYSRLYAAREKVRAQFRREARFSRVSTRGGR